MLPAARIRAPTFSQIYGNSSALFVQNYSDPTKGGAITQGITLSGGNRALEPETAESYTFGVDFAHGQTQTSSPVVAERVLRDAQDPRLQLLGLTFGRAKTRCAKERVLEHVLAILTGLVWQATGRWPVPDAYDP